MRIAQEVAEHQATYRGFFAPQPLCQRAVTKLPKKLVNACTALIMASRQLHGSSIASAQEMGG